MKLIDGASAAVIFHEPVKTIDAFHALIYVGE